MDKSQTNIESKRPSMAFITQLENSHHTFLTQDDENNEKVVTFENPENEAGKLPTKLGVLGEINVINGILEKVKAKTNKINPNSPRTKKALENLGILKEECIVKKFEDFKVHAKNEKMSKLLYVYYVGHVNDTINEVLRERENLLKKNGRKTSIDRGNRLMNLRLDKIIPATTKPKKTPIFLPDYETRIERIEATKQNKISAIEQNAMTYLEEERDYLKKKERIIQKQEKFDINRRKIEEKRLKEILQKQLKYSQSVDKYRKTQQEKEDEIVKANLELHSPPGKNYKRNLLKETLKQIQEHKEKEMKIYENQKQREKWLEKKNQEELFYCTFVDEEINKKHAHSKSVYLREKDHMRLSIGNWKEKYNKTRENAILAKVEDFSELYNQFGEKMKKIEDDKAKREAAKQKEMSEKKKEKEGHFKRVEDRLQNIRHSLDEREKILAEKVAEQSERLDQFYFSRKQLYNQKADLNKFRMHRSQIHFHKVSADNTHRCNVIMSKTKTWKEGYEKKQKEKEILRDISMKYHLKIRSEKESLMYYLDQVSKIHAKTDLIAGKLKRVQTAFNTQHMANYISSNFNQKFESHPEDHAHDH